MKRYDMSINCDSIMVENENGEFVKFEDVRQKLDMFDEIISFLDNNYDVFVCGAALYDDEHVGDRIDIFLMRARALQEAGK